MSEDEKTIEFDTQEILDSVKLDLDEVDEDSLPEGVSLKQYEVSKRLKTEKGIEPNEWIYASEIATAAIASAINNEAFLVQTPLGYQDVVIVKYFRNSLERVQEGGNFVYRFVDLPNAVDAVAQVIHMQFV